MTPSTLPPIDEPYTGAYSARLNYEPPIEESGPGVSFRLEDDAITVIEGWFVPDGLDPISGTNATGRGIGGGDLLPYGGDRPLSQYFTRDQGETTIDVVLVIEDQNGARSTVSIDDARFDRVE